MSEVPESKEVIFHHYRTEITKLERDILATFRTENTNRWSRVSELDEFWTALQSHTSIDDAWLTDWRERMMSILKGDRP